MPPSSSVSCDCPYTKLIPCSWFKFKSHSQAKLFTGVSLVVISLGLLGLRLKQKRDQKKRKFKVLFVLGGPGAGKGTQCAKLTEEYPDCVAISAGDLLRAERAKKDSQNGQMIDNYIKNGKIVPAIVTVNLLKEAMESYYQQGKTVFLIDGFPRSEENLNNWIENMSDVSETKGCLFLECPEEVMQTRLLERGKTSGRADDNLESIKKRFSTLKEQTMPIVKVFQKQKKLIQVVADRSPEEVFQEIKSKTAFIFQKDKKFLLQHFC